jgi:hypothetical protein
METVITIVGMRWAPFGLDVSLIANSSASFGDLEDMVEFYKCESAMPLCHCVSFSNPILGQHGLVVNTIRIRRTNDHNI